MSKKTKRTPLGWVATSSGTYHLRVEIAGKATRRVVACGARVEKGAVILTDKEMIEAVKGNKKHVCHTCLHSPLLAPPSVKWGRGGFLGERRHGSGTILRYDNLGINVGVGLDQIKKLHEKLGEYINKVDPPQTATVTITALATRDGKEDIIQAVKCLRDHLGLSLKDAVERIKGLPVPFAVFTGDRSKGEALVKGLEATGYGVEIRDEP